VTLAPVARAGVEPVLPKQRTLAASPVRRKPVATKLIRPGTNGVAGIPGIGGCLVAESFSREANATGIETTGMTGFYECTVAKGFAIFAAPTHWLLNRGANGMGDVAFGPKYVFNRETAILPMFAVAYSYKQPTASGALGSGFHDHKITTYADKNFGVTRISANFISKWEGHATGPIHQYMESLGVLRPVRGKLGMALQAFYSSSSVVNYGGALAAGVYHFTPDFSTHVGLEHGFGPRSADLGVVWGVTYLYRGPVRR